MTTSSRIPLYVQILLAMVVGMLVGPWLGVNAQAFGEIGKVVIQLIKAVATPLLFLAIVSAVLKTEVNARDGVRLIGVATLNGSIALGIGLTLANWFQPGSYLTLDKPKDAAVLGEIANKKIDFLKTFTGFIPSNIVQPFAENIVLSVVLLALLLGFGLRAAKRELPAEIAPIESALAGLYRVSEIVLGWVIKLIPLAVFGVVAKTIGEHGFSPLRGLAAYVGVGLLGMLLQIAFTYQAEIAWLTRLSLRKFWSHAKEPVAYAMGTNSSLATLPVTLRALDRIGVSRASSTLGACVGTNFNNDGIILYEGMAVLFVAQAYGIHLSMGQQLLAAASCLVAAMGVAGIPEAGFISLALVLNTVGLPVEILPLLLTVDWVVARARSVTNVLSDMVLSALLDRAAGERVKGP